MTRQGEEYQGVGSVSEGTGRGPSGSLDCVYINNARRDGGGYKNLCRKSPPLVIGVGWDFRTVRRILRSPLGDIFLALGADGGGVEKGRVDKVFLQLFALVLSALKRKIQKAPRRLGSAAGYP